MQYSFCPLLNLLNAIAERTKITDIYNYAALCTIDRSLNSPHVTHKYFKSTRERERERRAEDMISTYCYFW